METIQVHQLLTDHANQNDEEAEGVWKRLLAGLQSVADRSGNPRLLRVEQGIKGSPPYRDCDVLFVVEPGDGYNSRQVTGEIGIVCHITGSGGIHFGGFRRDESDLDLVVYSHDEQKSTRFMGAIPNSRDLGFLPEGSLLLEVEALLKRILMRALAARVLEHEDIVEVGG
jgi:hypothetical protein